MSNISTKISYTLDENIRCIFFCEKKILSEFCLIVRIYNRSDFRQVEVLHSKHELFYLVQKVLDCIYYVKLHHFENDFMTQSNVEKQCK